MNYDFILFPSSRGEAFVLKFLKIIQKEKKIRFILGRVDIYLYVCYFSYFQCYSWYYYRKNNKMNV